MSDEQGTNRRELLKKAAYIAPIVLTMAVTPSFAGTGSGSRGGGNHGRSGNGNRGQDDKPGKQEKSGKGK